MRIIAALVVLLFATTACVQQRTDEDTSTNTAPTATPTLAALTYPEGVVVPVDWYEQQNDGIYASVNPKECCFLAPVSKFTLNNPAGTQRAVFFFYVPSLAPFKAGKERVAVQFDGIASGSPAPLLPGGQQIIFSIPPALQKKPHLVATLTMSYSWVPKKLGVNGDTRTLTVILTKVGYI